MGTWQGADNSGCLVAKKYRTSEKVKKAPGKDEKGERRRCRWVACVMSYSGYSRSPSSFQRIESVPRGQVRELNWV